jgi:hypothetical protein
MTKAATRTPSTSTTAIHVVDRDRIAERAHQIYVERGGRHGQDLDDWLQAERELTSVGAPGNGKSNGRTRKPAARTRKKIES